MMRAWAFATVSGLALAISAATPVAAQGAGETRANEVEQLVVTARRREERLIDVPVAATAITAEDIKAQGELRGMQDLVANAPAVHFLDTTSPTNSEVSIRGSGTARGSNAQSGVGLYRDGAYIGGGGLGGRTFSRNDLFDVGRAEVLRGPQGALYGRNAVGGAINMISQQPTFRRSGEFFTQLGTNGYEQYQLIYNMPLNDMVSIRLGADYTDQKKGFYYIPTQDQYFDDIQSKMFRGQVRFRSGGFDGRVLTEYYEGSLPNVAFQVYILPGNNAQFPRGYIQDKYNMPRNGPAFSELTIRSHELVWSYDFGAAKLDSSTLYRLRHTINAFDTDGVDTAELARLRAGGQGLTTDANAASVNGDSTGLLFQDLHLSGEAGPLNWLVGADYQHTISHQVNRNFRTPTPANGNSPGTRSPIDLKQISYAVYGSAGYDLTEKLNLTGELRYTADKKKFFVSRYDIVTNVPVQANRFTASGTSSPDNISYTASATYKLMQDVSAYAKVGTAFRAGGFNDDLGDPRAPNPVQVVYDNENSTTYEAGVKGNVLPGVFTSFVGYTSKVDDYLVQVPNGCEVGRAPCPVAGVQFLINGGEAELWGLEFETTVRRQVAGGRATFSFGVARQAGRIKGSGSSAGRIPRMPSYTANGNLNYRREIGSGLEGFFNVRMNASWGGFQDLQRDNPLDDYMVADLRAGVRRGRLEVALYADNATNESYIIFNAAGSRRWNLPRRVGVQLRYDF